MLWSFCHAGKLSQHPSEDSHVFRVERARRDAKGSDLCTGAKVLLSDRLVFCYLLILPSRTWTCVSLTLMSLWGEPSSQEGSGLWEVCPIRLFLTRYIISSSFCQLIVQAILPLLSIRDSTVPHRLWVVGSTGVSPVVWKSGLWLLMHSDLLVGSVPTLLIWSVIWMCPLDLHVSVFLIASSVTWLETLLVIPPCHPGWLIFGKITLHDRSFFWDGSTPHISSHLRNRWVCILLLCCLALTCFHLGPWCSIWIQTCIYDRWKVRAKDLFIWVTLLAGC